MANNKFKPKNVLTAYEWKLVSFLNKLLKPFFVVAQQFSKKKKRIAVKCNTYAAVLRKFFNHKANSLPG